MLSHYLTSDLCETKGPESPQWHLLSHYIVSGNLELSPDNVEQMLKRQLLGQLETLKDVPSKIADQIRETMRVALLERIPTLNESLESMLRTAIHEKLPDQFRLHLPIWGGLYHQFTTHHGTNPAYGDLFPAEVQQS